MNRQPFARPPRWWSPKLSERWIRVWRPLLDRDRVRHHRLVNVEVRGTEYIRDAVASQHGVLITPNHPGHSDCFSLYAASHSIQTPFYVMVAWQVFQRSGWIKQTILRHHGCFSVDREGTDLTALRQARSVLESSRYPLAIFPEGEVYHLNDRVTPFREGPASIALMAAKKATRPIVLLPCAIKYRYVDDPTPELLRVMTRLEEAVLWRARPDLPLQMRIYRFAEGLLSLKEIELLGGSGQGSLPERIRRLTHEVLQGIEREYGLTDNGATTPERVKTARQAVIKRLQELPADGPELHHVHHQLDELFLVVQAFSYPGDYVAEQPSIERMAETIDKFEEDVLGAHTATVRGRRRAIVSFGEPVPVLRDGGKRQAAGEVTRELELRVQQLLNTI